MSDVDVTFGANTSNLDAGVKHVAGAINGLRTDALQAFTGSLTGLAAGITAAFSVVAIKDFTASIGDAAERLDQLHQKTGMSVSDISRWDAVMTASGSSVENLANAAVKLEKSLVAAKGGAKEQSEALKDLGINAASASDANEVLLRIADRFKEMPDGPKKVSDAMVLMGRSGAEMIPILNSGREGLQAQFDVAEKYGIVVGDRFMEMGLTIDQAMDESGMATKGLSMILADQLGPSAIVVANAFNDTAAAFIKSYREGGTAKGVMDSIAVTLKSLTTVAVVFGGAMRQAWQAGMVVGLEVAGLIDAVGRAMYMLVHGRFSEIGTAFESGWQKGKTLSGEQLAQMRQMNIDEAAFISNLWKDNTAGASPAVHRQGPIDLGNGTNDAAAKAARQAAEKRLQAEIAEIEARKQMAEDDYQERMRLEDLKLEKLKAFYGEDSVQYKMGLREKTRMEQQHVQEVLRMESQRLNAEERLQETRIQSSQNVSDAMMQKARDEADFLVSIGKMSAEKRAEVEAGFVQQELADAISHEDLMYDLAASSLQNQLALEGLRPEEKARINQQIEQLEADHAGRMAEIQAKGAGNIVRSQQDAAKTVLDKWTSIVEPVASSLGNAFTGLVQRTMTWRQAFLGVVSDAFNQFVGWGVKMATKWAAMEIAKTTATTAGATARVGVEAAAAAATTTVSATSALMQIGHAAAVAAARAWSAIAGIPVIGPVLAPAVAAAALAGVFALGKTIASAAGGWDQVPADGMMTELHKNEMVLPAKLANPLRSALQGPWSVPATGLAGRGASGAGDDSSGPGGTSNGGGRGDTYHIHAMDGRDVERVLRKHGVVVQGVVERQVRDGFVQERF